MIPRLIRKVLALAFVAAIAVNLYLIAAIVNIRLQHRYVKSQYGVATDDRPSAPFAGFDVNGLEIDQPRDGRGTAVWYASKDCPYCKREEQWPALAAALRQRGLRVIVLLPGREHRFAPDNEKASGADQVAFIGGEWLTQFPQSVTPTLLIFDASHRLVWYKRGMLSAADPVEALRAADSITASAGVDAVSLQRP